MVWLRIGLWFILLGLFEVEQILLDIYDFGIEREKALFSKYNVKLIKLIKMKE